MRLMLSIKIAAVKCRHLSAPQYGKVKTSAYTVGSTAEYGCTYGYRLHGESKRTCGYDGEWDGKEPVCRRKRK